MMILTILVVIGVLVLAIIVGIILTPITYWAFVKMLDIIANFAHKVARSKKDKVCSTKNKIDKPELRNYGFSLGPFKIGVNEPIYNSYITYLNNRSCDNLNNDCFNMVFKPLVKCSRNPVYKAVSHLKRLYRGRICKSTKCKQYPIYR